MAIRWRPDTCNCVLILNEACDKMVNWEVKCATHKIVSNDLLFGEVISENKKYGFADGYEYTDEEVDAKSLEKQEAKIKNLNKGKVEINKKL